MFRGVLREPSQTSKMELFADTGIERKPLTIFAKSSILDLLLGSKYASEKSNVKCILKYFSKFEFRGRKHAL